MNRLRLSIDRPWRARVGALVLVALLILMLPWAAAVWLQAAQDFVGDWSWRVAATPREAERRVVVVDIDEDSLRQVGPWPWSRETLAQLSTRLNDAGAALQVYDMVFPEAREGDEALRTAWSKSAVVVGQIFSLDPRSQPRQGVISAASTLGACHERGFGSEAVAQGWVANSPSILPPQAAVGHLTPRLGLDGVIRRVPAWICHEGQRYPSLALAALTRLLAPSAPSGRVEWQLRTASGAFSPGQPPRWLQSTQAPGFILPVDEYGDMLVPYRLARESVTSVSAGSVLAGRADINLFRGAIVVVGATAFGLTDTVSTPLSSVASGVEVHVQSLVGILDHQVPYRPQAALAALGGTMAVTALLLLALVRRKRLSARTLPLTGVLLGVVWAVGGVSLLPGLSWDLPWAQAALYSVVAAVVLAALEHSFAKGQRERLSAHLSAYLPEPVAAQLVRLEPTGQLDARRREITVWVANLRNFDAFAIHSPPEEVAATLHAYTCLAVQAVEANGGVVEQVAGDRIVAVWNAYADDAQHPVRALAAAKALIVSTRDLLSPKAWGPEASTLQPLGLGIGMESGDAIVGSFGPAKRRAHAALGEPVGVAARLQGMTTDLSLPILIGPRLAAALPQAALETQGEYLIEGQRRSMEVFAPADWAQWLPPETVWPASSLQDAQGTDGLETWSSELPRPT
ncbi:CHASE2 domain-containing protein [Inhella gelatinilytica]|uniref:Adenylate/guanylate cyclase domain-containing protein n=1 Tax=Inhella gelatinilytica TaxID=2795030 RepID=A0A931ITH1_9BURK|nr:adenylate/guanylate cyclase domain-containing protein [Inhella gelatinilytica]MBH9551216.1 adenylate/guanylate cyclase domain-containing protein [Inhella gelatinilytica]